MARALSLTKLSLIIAVAYVVSGRLGLLLAIPPGYATAIFPPAGVALGALLLFGRPAIIGVWLGSLALNIWIGGGFSAFSVLIAALIASGSSLQALAGHWLIARFIGLPITFEEGRSHGRFAILAACLAPLIGASVGTGTLLAAGLLPGWDALPFAWLTWWVGDGIGVLLVTPVMLMLWAQPASYWRPLARKVVPMLLLTLAVVVWAFYAASHWEQANLRESFARISERLGNQIESSVQHTITELESLERFFAASQRVDHQEFSTFVNTMLRHRPAINAIEWAPLVLPEQLSAHQSAMRQIHPGYRVWQREEQGQADAANAPPFHAPIAFLEPFERHAAILGFDLASSPQRLEALQRARASGDVAVSRPLRLLQDSGDALGVLSMRYVSSTDHAEAGFVIAAVQIEQTLKFALEDQPTAEVRIRMTDRSDEQAPILLFDSASASLSASSAVARNGLSTQRLLELGGRRWLLEFHALPGFVESRHPWQAWLVLVAGLLFAALLASTMTLAASRESAIARVVTQRTRELQRSESLQRAIVDSSPEGLLLLDAAGRILSINAYGRVMLGYDDQALLGKPLSPLLSEAERLNEWLAGHSDERVRFETSVADAANALVPVELTATRVEVSEERRYSVQLHDMRQRYELDQLKREFVSTVSHELRTPLTALRGAVRLLQQHAGLQLPPAASQLLEVADRNGERLAHLINDLLDFEKLSIGTLQLQLSRVQLEPFLRQHLADLEPYAKRSSISLHLECEHHLPDIFCAPDRLAQVLSNLVSNAVKFSPAGSEVWLKAGQLRNRVRLEVIDQGPGIPAELQPRIFEKFWQADGSTQRRHPGTGLGLAITKLLVEKMGGQIGFKSSSRGSVFWVEFNKFESG
ncbi:CHASE domain-containing protein [Pseudomarimonas arenosa]|uniref:histidine kinase n=1 Tax=Pseudomarimonas arenosa TaxID=2774145 RepID=A0AAW3ZQQ6_9GAMM|nr:CHASE domain-containing protein [Pseudomarimonas arenosa]MBD8526611.1 CHASE domain-containing protein [Pseudomarimonas arenosa]